MRRKRIKVQPKVLQSVPIDANNLTPVLTPLPTSVLEDVNGFPDNGNRKVKGVASCVFCGKKLFEKRELCIECEELAIRVNNARLKYFPERVVVK